MSYTKGQREWVVRRLAAFETPRDIAIAFFARFSVKIDENGVLAIDPRIAVVEPELHALFYSERAAILEDPDKMAKLAPYAAKWARLITLSRQVERYERNNQPADARAVLRQIAEETGDVAGKGGKSPAGGEGGAPITEIRRTIVRSTPKPEEVA